MAAATSSSSARGEELDALQAMFCGNGEFEFVSSFALPPVGAESKSAAAAQGVPTTASASGGGDVSFDIRLTLDPTHILSVRVTLPSSYPDAAAPHITVSGNWLSSPNTIALNGHLQQQLKSLCAGAADSTGTGMVVLGIMSWMQEQSSELVSKYMTVAPPQPTAASPTASTPTNSGGDDPNEMIREWILFHHMYSTHKKKMILDTAKRLALSGLSVPGKPGLIIVEGTRGAVHEFVGVIRGLNWQKMSCKLTQKIEQQQRVWTSFSELVSAAGAGGGGQHSDVSQLMAICERAGLGGAAREVLGLAKPTAGGSGSGGGGDTPASPTDVKSAASGSGKSKPKAAPDSTAPLADSKHSPAHKHHSSNNKTANSSGKGNSKSSTTAAAPAPPTGYLSMSSDGTSVLIAVSVQPNAKHTMIASTNDRELCVRLNAPPRDGEANDELVRFLGEVLGLKSKSIAIVKGQKSRTKTVAISSSSGGVSLAAAATAIHTRFTADSASK